MARVKNRSKKYRRKSIVRLAARLGYTASPGRTQFKAGQRHNYVLKFLSDRPHELLSKLHGPTDNPETRHQLTQHCNHFFIMIRDDINVLAEDHEISPREVDDLCTKLRRAVRFMDEVEQNI